MFNFEPEFKYTDIVIISCGVNDMSRYGKRAHVLADLVTKRFRECCEKNSQTRFVFTSVLSTRYDWLNQEIGNFNRIMFDLCLEVPNLSFFDSHDIIMNSSLVSTSSVLLPADISNGVHITLAAKKLITHHLVNAVQLIASTSYNQPLGARMQFWKWPLRPIYRASYSSMMSVRSRGNFG